MSTEPNESPKSEQFGRLAFAWCKIATVSLIAGRFALPVAALLSAGFFIAAWIKGKHDTKCFVRQPLVTAGLWILVLSIWLWAEFAPVGFPSWLGWIHR